MPFVRIAIVCEVLHPDPAGRKAGVGAKLAGAIAEATGLPELEIEFGPGPMLWPGDRAAAVPSRCVPLQGVLIG
ncbi:hypothetical protein [Mesorhizobium sp. L-8-3]|uniref:hypothetical protein n=1 Tax=Mesorhizobium sp. L-8-3 TaxID=2744522 RepID=UPI001928BD70|nr:hypothetical protein [Mesorhizobium sp. L-8-3]BCH25476.1 hypothetical protein MesoLjLb_52610 [Mesorhizobium sp. L-8-3]